MLIYMYNFVGLKHILIKLLHYLVSLATSLGIKAIRLLKFAFKLYTSNKDYRGDRCLRWLVLHTSQKPADNSVYL